MLYIVCEGTTYNSTFLTDIVNKWKRADIILRYRIKNQYIKYDIRSEKKWTL